MRFTYYLSIVCSFLFLATANASYDDTVNPVIGYQYNLWGIKADRLSGDETLLYTGRIFLDVRKEFKASYDEDEHWFFSKEHIEDGQVLRIQGSDKASLEVKHQQTEDFYVTLKLGNKWSRFYYQDILNEEKSEVGKEVGCEECNFSEQIYLPEQDWILTLYFEIKPHYKFSKIDTSTDESLLLTAEDSLREIRAMNALSLAENKVTTAKEKAETQNSITPEEEDGDQIYVLSTHKMPGMTDVASNGRAPQKISFSPTRYYPKSAAIKDTYTDATIPLIPVSTEKTYHVLFRIMPSPYEEFEDLSEIGTLYRETYQENGKTRYMIGHTATLEEARIIAKKIQDLGYRNLFIASYQDGSLQKYVERLKE